MPASVQTRRQVVQRFALCFICTCVILYTLANGVPSSWVTPVNTLTAKLLGTVLEWFGIAVTVNGVMVRVAGFSVKIITECSALFVFILFFAFLSSYPATRKDKLIGLAVGIPVLFCFNLFRLVIVFVTGMGKPELFGIVHVYLGQIAMVLVVLMTCMVWLRAVTTVTMRDNPWKFLQRFIAWSCLPFILWLSLHDVYVLGQLYGIKTLLGVFGYGYRVPAELEIYPHTFDTFNLVTYTALVLATKSLLNREKIKALVLGGGVLSVTHFAFRLLQILYLDFGQRVATGPFVGLIIINEWVLPFVLWLIVVWKEVFVSRGIHACPLCGKEVKGLMDHVKAKHGEEGLRDRRVQALLDGIDPMEDLSCLKTLKPA